MLRPGLLITCVVLALSACGSEHDHGHSETHDDSTQLQISLNDGSKWQMDEHTRSMFKAMASRVKTGGDTRSLGGGLQTDLDKLIQGCTMTGEAHNQLHVFLTAYIPAVHEVSESGTDEALTEVQDLLAEYPAYFE